jgi:hypothetical protein
MTDAFVPDFARVENGALAGRFVACFWQPIAASKDYAPSVVKRIKILGNHYTLYRGGDNVVRLVQDRCPHRGTSLAYGWVKGKLQPLPLPWMDVRRRRQGTGLKGIIKALSFVLDGSTTVLGVMADIFEQHGRTVSHLTGRDRSTRI